MKTVVISAFTQEPTKDGDVELSEPIRYELRLGSRAWRRPRSLVEFPGAQDFRISKCEVRSIRAPRLAIGYTELTLRKGRVRKFEGIRDDQGEHSLLIVRRKLVVKELVAENGTLRLPKRARLLVEESLRIGRVEGGGRIHFAAGARGEIGSLDLRIKLSWDSHRVQVRSNHTGEVITPPELAEQLSRYSRRINAPLPAAALVLERVMRPLRRKTQRR
jgi:hypothetical protein